jgi:HEPN domain-containing protein
MSHSLTYLAGKAGLDVPQKLLDSLEVLSGFNLSSRYPDEKFQFHKLADAKFVKVWEGRAKEFLKWLQDSQN